MGYAVCVRKAYASHMPGKECVTCLRCVCHKVAAGGLFFVLNCTSDGNQLWEGTSDSILRRALVGGCTHTHTEPMFTRTSHYLQEEWRKCKKERLQGSWETKPSERTLCAPARAITGSLRPKFSKPLKAWPQHKRANKHFANLWQAWANFATWRLLMASGGAPKILQTCIDVPRIKVPKRTFLPLSLGSLQRWGYVHPRRLEVKDLACAKLKGTLWFCMILHQKRLCILHVCHCLPQWKAKFAHENPKQTSRPVSGNASLVYMQRCIAGEKCCHLEVSTNEKLEVFCKQVVNHLWRVWQHSAESVVKKKMQSIFKRYHEITRELPVVRCRKAHPDWKTLETLSK